MKSPAAITIHIAPCSICNWAIVSDKPIGTYEICDKCADRLRDVVKGEGLRLDEFGFQTKPNTEIKTV